MPRPNTELWPYGVYDTKKCLLVHLGLYASEQDVWQTWLGWPDKAEIEDAKKRGLRVIKVTVQYDPPRS